MVSHLGSALSTSCEVGVELLVLLFQGLSCPQRIAPLSPDTKSGFERHKLVSVAWHKL